MGRYNFAAQNVHKYASQLLHVKKMTAPPPWYETVERIPPSTRLIRQPAQRSQLPGAKQPRQRKRSRLFQPISLQYTEDHLRWEYFNDHPWELARPRVILENDGRDLEKWDWSLPLDYGLCRPRAGETDKLGQRLDELWEHTMKTQASRPINGEAVVQRQQYLIQHEGHSRLKAYDQARKELYKQRHAKEVEVRVAREEALATGAFFGLGPLEVGELLENAAYDDWKSWAIREIAAQKHAQGAAYTGSDIDNASPESGESEIAASEEIGGESTSLPGIGGPLALGATL